MSENQTSVDSWDGLLSNYLKAENLKEQEEDFACVGVEVSEKDMDLSLERNEGKDKYVFSLNVTNKVFLKEHGIASPKKVIGKKITLKKVLAMNPNTKKEVNSLRISAIE